MPTEKRRSCIKTITNAYNLEPAFVSCKRHEEANAFSKSRPRSLAADQLNVPSL